MKKLATVLFCAVVICGCGTAPLRTTNQSFVDVTVTARIHQSGQAKSLVTTWDSLVVRATGGDCDTVYSTVKIGMSAGVYTAILAVPTGKNRKIDVWTKNKTGQVIHSSITQTVTVALGVAQSLTVWLNPVRGSIAISLADIPDNIEIIAASFVCGSTNYISRVRIGNSVIVNFSIDNVLDGATGILWLYGIDSVSVSDFDTLYHDSLRMTFRATKDTSMSTGFAQGSGNVSVGAEIVSPATTLVSAYMGSGRLPGTEVGPLIISEILYSGGGDSEYVELYNPTARSVNIDTMILEIEGSATVYKSIFNVSVTAGGFFVIGDLNAPKVWAGTTLDTCVTMDLTSSRWITFKKPDGTVIDRVGYSDESSLGWPEPTTRHSIELDSLPVSPLYNNYGDHWQAATTLIGGVGNYFGSIGR